MRRLSFEIKRNLKKSPRIHVKSSVTSAIYGSFLADKPDKFEGWKQMSKDEAIELKHYINNLNAVRDSIGIASLNEQSDYRLRLPISFTEAIDEISLLCDGRLNIYEPMINAMIQATKIAIVKLKKEDKAKALSILDKLGLAEYKKLDYSCKIQAIFAEVLSIHNKSEKLHKESSALFDKNKSYSPKAIESMAAGESTPSRWLVSCAITLLFKEKPDIIKAMLSDDDVFMLFAKPLLDNKHKAILNRLVKKFKLDFLIDKIMDYEG